VVAGKSLPGTQGALRDPGLWCGTASRFRCSIVVFQVATRFSMPNDPPPTEPPDDTERPEAGDRTESAATPPRQIDEKAALVGALAGFVVGSVLGMVIASVTAQEEVAKGAETGFVDTVLPLLSAGILAGIPGALAGCLGGLSRRVVIGAAAGSVFPFFCCFLVVVPVADSGGVSPFFIIGTMVAFNAICGACGAIAARSLDGPDGNRGPLQFSIGDALMVTFLFAVLVGCTVFLVRQ
jgi:hypothetical protein